MSTIRHLDGKYRTVTFRLVQLCDDAELRLYLALKFHAIGKDSCFPSVARLVALLNDRIAPGGKKWSRRGVFRTLDAMRKSGRLAVESGKARGMSSVYDITWYDRENERGFTAEQPVENVGTDCAQRADNPVENHDGVCQIGTPGVPKTTQGGVPDWHTKYKEYKNKEIEKRTVTGPPQEKLSEFKKTDGRKRATVAMRDALADLLPGNPPDNPKTHQT